MKQTASRGIGILATALCLLLVLTAGCLVPEYGVGRDIMVFKVDAGGTEQWQTVIDTGGDDTGACMIQTADGGYLIGGEVRPWREDLTLRDRSHDQLNFLPQNQHSTTPWSPLPIISSTTGTCSTIFRCADPN